MTVARVLVTGGAGFVGRASIRALLEAGHETHVADLAPSGVGGAVEHSVDLLAPGAAQAIVEAIRPTHLLHVAWFARPGEYWTSTENLRWLSASFDLARAFADAGGSRFVGVGSCAEYDWRYGFCSEEVTPLDPATLYGASKGALRRVLAPFAQQRGTAFAWARLFFLYGPREAPGRLVSSVCASLLRGEPTRCSSGEQIRDFLHVDDVGRALALVVSSDFTGDVNIGSGDPTRLRTIVSELARAAGRPELARFGDLPDKPGEPPLLVPDVARLRALGFRPCYSLAKGLEATLAWWREQGSLAR